MKSTRKYSDVAGAPDADVQRAIAGMPDMMVAAALLGPPEAVADKIVANLSKRRRTEISEAARDYSDRTRELSRRLLIKLVFGSGLKEKASVPEESPRRKAYRKLLEKMGENHPTFRQAREQRWMILLTEHLRGMVRDS